MNETRVIPPDGYDEDSEEQTRWPGMEKPMSQREQAEEQRRRNLEERARRDAIPPPPPLDLQKFLGEPETYHVGPLSLILAPVKIRGERELFEIVRSLPLILQVAAQCGIREGGRGLDFQRAAEILSIYSGDEVTERMAAALWQDFAAGDGLEAAVPGLSDALAMLLIDMPSQGLAWPRPTPPPAPIMPPYPPEPEPGASPEIVQAWEAEVDKIVLAHDDALVAWGKEYEAAVEAALPPGARWLDSAIEDSLHAVELPLLIGVIFAVQGAFEGSMQEVFTHP